MALHHQLMIILNQYSSVLLGIEIDMVQILSSELRLAIVGLVQLIMMTILRLIFCLCYIIK